MSDNKKYYYLKLKETFFDSEEMKMLESQDNGIQYQNLYFRMCLLSLKSEGLLLFKNILPYDLKMLSTVLRVNIDTIMAGIAIFQQIGLVSKMDNGTIFMADIQSLIGRSSTEAERIKSYREKTKQSLITTDSAGVQMYEECTPELELELEKEIRDKKETPIKLAKSYSELFLNFYDEYPIKKGKDKAQKTFNSLIKNGIEYQYILDCLKNYKDEIHKKHTGQDYIKHPSTFLNSLSDYEISISKPISVSVHTTAPKICPNCGAELKGTACPKCFSNFDSEGKEI